MQASPANIQLYLQVAPASLTVDMYTFMRDEFTVSHRDLSTAYPNRTKELMPGTRTTPPPPPGGLRPIVREGGGGGGSASNPEGLGPPWAYWADG